MATLSFDIPANQVDRIVDALATSFGYQEGDGDKTAFVKAMIITHLKRRVLRVEADEAAETQAANAQDPDIS